MKMNNKRTIVYNEKTYSSLMSLFLEYIARKENESVYSYHKRCKRILFPDKCIKYKQRNKEYMRIQCTFRQLCKIQCY